MNKRIIIIQRFYYNFREGFFEYLSDIGYDFKLINATSSRGRVKVHSGACNFPFIEKAVYFFLGENYVIFPFLFFRLLRDRPNAIVTEGGQNTINNFQVLLYSKIFKCKYIVWDLGKGYADFGSSFFRNIYMSFYKCILRNASFIYGYNSQSREYFNSLGFDKGKVVVLNNTVDTRKINKIMMNASWKIPEEISHYSKQNLSFLIFVGTLLRTKNLESMADLLKILGSHYCLIIVGDGDPAYKEELKNVFNGTNHIFVGYKRIDELLPYYKVADFALLPGLGGLAINQSMAFGVPVVCSAADGAEKDLVINNKTGYIYKDIEDAARYILSKTSCDWKSMGEACKDLIFTEYSVEVMMEKFVHFAEM